MEKVETPQRRQHFREVYGLLWPLESTDLSIELACYRDPAKYPTGNTGEGHLRNAFKIVWPNFKWNDWCDRMIWAWCNYRLIIVIGHTRASKSYFFAFVALLDYLAAPRETATTFTTTKFDALKIRMWGDLMRAIETSSIRDTIALTFKSTSTQNEMTVKYRGSAADDKFMIQGVATDSADKSAGKIRGQHADRRRIFGDEAQDIAPAMFMAILNAMSAPDFKGVLLTNPVEKISDFGEWCKPKNGWDSIHDTDLQWELEKPHGICLHFDGLQSPNIRAGRTLFPYMLTEEYVNNIKASKGEDSLEWWMYIRGFFPPDGMVAKIWPSATIERARNDETFDYAPTPFGTLDPAFDHDNCAVHFGVMGKLRGEKWCAAFRETVVVKVKVSPGEPEKDYQIARECIRLCKERNIKPEDFIMDMTGNARGIYAIMRNEWVPGKQSDVQGIYYGGEATERPLRLDDPLPACDQVKYFVTELWFRASYLARDGMIVGLQNTDKRTAEDLNSRRYTIKNFGDRKLMVAESKDEMKKRIGRSPDFGDAACGVAELMMRKGMIASSPAAQRANGFSKNRERAKRAQKRYVKEFAHNG